MARWAPRIVCIGLCLFTLGCQTTQKAVKSDPAYDLQQAQAQSQPVQTPIPSSASDQPIVITELSANDAAALSDGMLNETPTPAKPQAQTNPTPKPAQPVVVVEEPQNTNTTPFSQQSPMLQSQPEAVSKGPSYTALARNVQKAHGMWRWTDSRCVQTDIQIAFGGKVRLQGTLLTDRNAGRIRLALNNGTVLIYDGKNVWMSPANAPINQPRFDALTWAYFLTVPFKLNDQGTHLANLGPLPLINGQNLPAAKLTFGPNVGDSPDDWYVCYVDPQTHWLRGMAYIVTYGKSVDEAEKAPHAITYDNYINVAGVILPRTWTFWNWTQDQGITGQPIGRAILSNMQMVYPAANSFIKSDDAALCNAPQ
jgi:hypothetical protein